jgi:phage terminase small subunit
MVIRGAGEQGKAGPICLTARQRIFVREYLRTQNVQQAAVKAGIKSPASYGYRLRQNPKVQAAIAQAQSDVRWLFAQEAAEALSMLVELMANGQSDSVRLRAAQEILDRAAGDKRPERQGERASAAGAQLLDYADPAAVATRVEELRRRLLWEAGAGDQEKGEKAGEK